MFYTPHDLPALYPYGRWHILRRRARVDPAEPDLRKYPQFASVVGTEALLEPGDILWFPGALPSSDTFLFLRFGPERMRIFNVEIG